MSKLIRVIAVILGLLTGYFALAASRPATSLFYVVFAIYLMPVLALYLFQFSRVYLQREAAKDPEMSLPDGYDRPSEPFLSLLVAFLRDITPATVAFGLMTLMQAKIGKLHLGALWENIILFAYGMLLISFLFLWLFNRIEKL